METLQASALPTALDAILAFPVPRAPLAWLPGAHLAHVAVVAGAADGPLENQQEQAGVSHPVQHRQGTALLWELLDTSLCVVAIISDNTWKEQAGWSEHPEMGCSVAQSFM